jgi:hypothetical protein
MKIEVETQEELNRLKDKAIKVKVIAFSQMEKPPLTNGSFLSKKEKRILMEKMTELFAKPDAEIDEEFNKIVNEEVLDGGKDISEYPVYYAERQKYIIDRLEAEEAEEKAKKEAEKSVNEVGEKVEVIAE